MKIYGKIVYFFVVLETKTCNFGVFGLIEEEIGSSDRDGFLRETSFEAVKWSPSS
jgi:hypothetical protein